MTYSILKTAFIKSAHGTNCDNDIWEGLVVTDPPLQSKIHCFLVGGTNGYRSCFFLNLHLK
jgi:hypothetical protein